MPRLTKIYTRTGDDGTTALGTKRRVTKDSLRVCAYGDVDELNSLLGLALASGLTSTLADVLPVIQHELFNLGTDLAFPSEDRATLQIPAIEPRHVTGLEMLMDEMIEEVGPLENFILPGGTIGAAHLQVARSVCRRAERTVVALAREEDVSGFNITYLNRLSDALFTMARIENHRRGVKEIIWDTSS